LEPLRRIYKTIAIKTATTAPTFIKVGRLPALTLFMKVGVGAVRFMALAIGWTDIFIINLENFNEV
jgi:hypothetical protein